MNYQLLYNNFKEYSDENEEQDTPFFAKATEDEIAVLTKLYEICAYDSLVWEKEDLNELKEISVSLNLIDFYKELNPINLPMNDSYIKLVDLQAIKEEYTALAPGCYTIKWGFLVIGTTIGGNPILTDLNEASLPVYIAEQTLIIGDGHKGEYNIGFGFPPDTLFEEYKENDIPVTYENIKKCLILIENRFDVFIEKLSCNKYDDLEELLD